MREIILFSEDFVHEAFLTALLRRLARENGVEIRIRPVGARGGHGRVVSELERFVHELSRGIQLPDMIVIGTDANCVGWVKRRKVVEQALGEVREFAHVAIPDPHIERWYLLDSAAFKTVVGRGCEAPDYKCERDRYKSALLQAIRDAGKQPLLGGIEYAQDLVENMDLRKIVGSNTVNIRSLEDLLKSLTHQFREWSTG